MPWSNSRTLSAAVSGLLSLSIATTALPAPKIANRLNASRASITSSIAGAQAINNLQLFSSDTVIRSPFEEAISLFGEQSGYTQEESDIYWNAINSKSEKTSINIFDLF